MEHKVDLCAFAHSSAVLFLNLIRAIERATLAISNLYDTWVRLTMGSMKAATANFYAHVIIQSNDPVW